MRILSHPEIARIESWESIDLTAVAAANVILESVREDPEAMITYATGNTMVPVYETTETIVNETDIPFHRTRAAHLDEYWPANPDLDEFSFVRYLRDRVFKPLQIPFGQRFEIDGTAADPSEEALRYDEVLSRNPVALAILGIGPGGHIGFNERGTSFVQRTHFTRLSQETIDRDHVERGLSTPEDVITQGIANIIEAKRILMVAFGAKKGGYLHEALYESITLECPASVLRMVGKKVIIIIDEAAAAELEKNKISMTS